MSLDCLFGFFVFASSNRLFHKTCFRPQSPLNLMSLSNSDLYFASIMFVMQWHQIRGNHGTWAICVR